jgi:hypothetical protein
MATNTEDAAMNGSPPVSRRTALRYGLAAGAGLALPWPARRARAGEERTLRPRPAQTSFFGAAGPRCPHAPSAR